MKRSIWPKKPVYWIENRTLFVSIPFTWELPGVYKKLKRRGLSVSYDNAIVGGPAVELMPGFFNDLSYVEERHEMPGVLQRINPLATRTTIGCIRRCKFCAIGSGKIEGKFKELDDWPDLPMITDNNLLAASIHHFDKVIDRLVKHGWADFNQGLDSRLLTDYHAKRLAEIKKPTIRLALDNLDYKSQWKETVKRLRDAGIANSNIASYCIIGFDSDPKECWQRCIWVQSQKVLPYPMWYHSLDQLEKNIITEKQIKLGWNEEERKRIMGFYYKHRGSIPSYATKEI